MSKFEENVQERKREREGEREKRYLFIEYCST